MRNCRAVASVSTALLLFAGLTACSGASDHVSAVHETTSPSPTASSTPSSATATATATADSANAGQALFVTMAAAMAKAKTAHATFTTAVAGHSLAGRGSFRWGKTDYAVDLTMAMPGMGKVRMIALPSALYLRLPASAHLPSGKPWIKIKADGTGTDPISKALGPVMTQMQESFDPQSNLELLKAMPAMKVAGRESIEGARTTKYKATVDLAKAAAVVAGGPLAKQFRALTAAGIKTMDYTIWVDGQGLPRQYKTVMATAQGKATQTFNYRDWGKPLTIKAPPAKQVAGAGSLSGG
jgi:hypothetical protein